MSLAIPQVTGNPTIDTLLAILDYATVAADIALPLAGQGELVPVIAALEALPDVQGAFNLGTGSGDSVRRVLDLVDTVTGLTVRREMTARRAGDPPVLVAGNRRAAARLGWRPRRNLSEAIADAWAWMAAHPDGYASD